MSAELQANLSFLPWVRQGAATAITTPDSLGAQQPAVADVGITLQVNGNALPSSVTVRLRGPADVVGIDPHQVVRTDPKPGTANFESNCFAAIELDRPDFPWLFTPAKANANTQLRPWLCLVVVRAQDGVSLTSTPATPLPTLKIVAPAKPFEELPNLKDSAIWAHSQVTAQNGADPSSVKSALKGSPALSLSRLVCPRLLTANTDYIACVVPTFELGRKAGLGLAITDTDLTAANAMAPAWALTATAPTAVTLPVYYSWTFRTGPGGDFEALAKRLHISQPQGLGRKTIDIRHPGFGLPQSFPATATVAIEGALKPMTDSGPPVLWSDSVAQPFEKALADIVNEPGNNAVIQPTADPLLAPPLYGRWHAARPTVNAGAANWFDELNLDPRWRAAAAIGTGVIQDHQEALMASAWEQAAHIRQVNQQRRQLQLSMAVGERIFTRHFKSLDEEKTLRIASPVFSRIRIQEDNALAPSSHTLLSEVANSALPIPATRPAMRRIGRQRGPLTRRVVSQGFQRDLAKTWVSFLKFGGGAAGVAAPVADQAFLHFLPSANDVNAAPWNYGFQIAAEGQPLIPRPVVDPLPPEWDYPGTFRAAAAAHLARIRPPVTGNAHFIPTLRETINLVLTQMNPRVTLPKLASATVITSPAVLQPTAPGVTPVGVETVMMAPSFAQPMYEALKEKSQDLLLPGLDAVEPDTVLGLQTNRAFVESYMIGLNFEMGRELLWRGFPTDQQGTYFRNFWASDASHRASDSGDIDDLRKHQDRVLGAKPDNAPAEEFVLFLRSSLLRRYPDAIIYLTPIIPSGSTGTPPPDVFPIFNGSMDPDISFLGFPLSPQAAAGSGNNPGYFVVIQEHPTGPRFGLDDDPNLRAALGNATHLNVVGKQPPAGLDLKGRTWGRNSAHMADIVRRLPVRITIPVSQLGLQ